MKILVLTNLYPPHFIGGYELICQTVVETLRDRGHSLEILTSSHHVKSAAATAVEQGVERALEINGLYGHPWHGLRQLRALEKHNNDVLRAALRRHRPELVYVWNMGGLSKSMLFTLQAAEVPTVYYISDHWIRRGATSDVWLRWWNREDAPRLHRWVRAGCQALGVRQHWNRLAPTHAFAQLQFRRIYFCSRALRDATVASGYRVGHGGVIHCPVHPRYFQEESRLPRRTVQKLLYVGRLAEDKGVMTALRALVHLRGRFAGQFSIFGHGDEDYEADLKAFVRDHDLPVTFHSAPAEEMPHVYRSHDILLFTSEWDEPFALTPIEAMACSLPVIGTMTGGSAELFRDGENGLTYQAGCAEELARRIEEFSDHALRAHCAVTAWSEARQRYAAPVIVDRIEAYLEESVRTWHDRAQTPRSPGMVDSRDAVCVS